MTVIHRDAPYVRTPTAVVVSKAAIEKLLMDYGAEGVRTTTLRDGHLVVEFVLETETAGVARRFACRVETPTIERTERGIRIRDNRAEARMLYWYVKALTEAASYGLMSAERTFFSHILFSLPDGTQATAGEAAERAIADGRAPTLPGFGGNARPALAPGRDEPADAEFTTEAQ